MRRFLLIGLFAVSSVLTGCGSFKAPNYSSDYDAVDAFKRAGLSSASVGKFEPQDPAAGVNEIRLRGAPMVASEGSFARYIERAVISDLTEAGLYDPKSGRRIELRLLKNDIDVSGINEGVGLIEVELAVMHSGTTLLKDSYAVSTRFESCFAGAVAIPRGVSEYPNLVRALLSKIYRDPAFLRAMK